MAERAPPLAGFLAAGSAIWRNLRPGLPLTSKSLI
jgi:hypothetical protein